MYRVIEQNYSVTKYSYNLFIRISITVIYTKFIVVEKLLIIFV